LEEKEDWSNDDNVATTQNVFDLIWFDLTSQKWLYDKNYNILIKSRSNSLQNIIGSPQHTLWENILMHSWTTRRSLFEERNTLDTLCEPTRLARQHKCLKSEVGHFINISYTTENMAMFTFPIHMLTQLLAYTNIVIIHLLH